MNTLNNSGTSLLIGAALFLLAGTSCDTHSDSTASESFIELKEAFQEPSAEYRSAPLAVWNDMVSPSEVDRTLTDLKEAGFGGMFIHPRPGMMTEYLSDEWFSLYNQAIETGKKLNMNVWIYDENSYPSGFAGGHVPATMPESYNQGQGLALTQVERLPDDCSPYFLCLKMNEDGQTWTDITALLDNYRRETGKYYLYSKTYQGRSDWYGGFSYVDLLVPGVTEKFLEVTMDAYKEKLGDNFSYIKGVFSDEPNISTSGGLRWTPDLFEQFEKRWGYDLKSVLPLLQEEVGDWKRVRHNYEQVLLDLFIERWSIPFSRYCEQNGMAWTGHYWEHGWPYLNDGPDNMAMYAWHQLPAIDMLFNQFDEQSPVAQFGNVRAVKELRSIANQTGAERTLSETYGGGGWEESFRDFKRLGDWEYVLGVNFLNQHLSHMTLKGARKYDYPPVFSYHSPWWREYREQNDYFARLSVALSKGVQQNDVLVVEPTTTLWEYYSHSAASRELEPIGRTFQKFVTQLEKYQVEYDLGSERIMAELGSVSEKQLVVGHAAYSTVVLPPMMENINGSTYALLRTFVEQGGRLITYSRINRLDGAENAEVTEWFNGPQVTYLKATGPQIAHELASPEFAVYASQTKIDRARLPEPTDTHELYHQRRHYKDGELLFLVNSSLEEPVYVAIDATAASVIEMDAKTGGMYAYNYTTEGKKLRTDARIEPAGSLMLYFFHDKKAPTLPSKPRTGTKRIEPTDELLVERPKDNVLNVSFCDLVMDGSTEKDLYFFAAANKAFKAHGFVNGNPWNTSVQYRRNILDRDTFQSGGFSACYHFTIAEDFDYSSMRVVAERPELFSMEVNGTSVSATPGEWFLDHAFGVYPVGSSLQKGTNTIKLTCHPMSIFAEIEPIYVIGDFSVRPEKIGWSIGKPTDRFTLGSWKEQQQPFYSWEMLYTHHYRITDTTRHYAVRLPEWSGTVATVIVNGRRAGNIDIEPYEVDITPYIQEGENEVKVVVYGSHKNMLGPHFRPSNGMAGPGHWMYTGTPIPGDDYPMIDYGLFKDFEVVSD